MANARKQKKEKFTKKEEKGVDVRLLGGAGVLILALVVFMFTGASKLGAQPAQTIPVTSPTVTSNGGDMQQTQPTKDPSNVYIPVSEVSDGIAHFYEYPSKSGKTIRFFVLKSSDGVIRAAFDACDVCYEAKKGYRQEGDYMICNNCGKRFPSNKINEVKGGCNPAPLNRNVVGGELVISKADIETGARYF